MVIEDSLAASVLDRYIAQRTLADLIVRENQQRSDAWQADPAGAFSNPVVSDGR